MPDKTLMNNESQEIDFSDDTSIKLFLYELAFVQKLADDIYEHCLKNRHNLTEREIILFMDKVKFYCQLGETIVETLKILESQKQRDLMMPCQNAHLN